MAKGDDALTRKRNKASRKKLRSKSGDSSAVSARVASIIAAKKRRMSGKRRQCQVTSELFIHVLFDSYSRVYEVIAYRSLLEERH